MLNSSIEALVAKSGDFTLRVNGRFLASSFDPRKEAQKWAASLTPLLKEDVVVILGLGCGYHIQALKDMKPHLKMYVVESQPQLAKLTLAHFTNLTDDSQQIKMIVEQTVHNAFEQLVALSALTHPFSIVSHLPSIALDPSFYEAVKSFLIAREPESFQRQLQFRAELAYEIDEAKLKNIISLQQKSPLSIHSVTALFKTTAHLSSERRLWKILEELVE
jgi:hypothetical protein